MKLKGAALVVGVCLLVGTASGWSYFPRRHRQHPIPCSLAPWRAFPIVQFSDFDDFFDGWPSLTNHHLWPLGIPYEDDWGRNHLENSHHSQDGLGSSGNDADNPEQNRLENLYQESAEKSKQVQQKMDKVQSQLDQVNRRSVIGGEKPDGGSSQRISCNQCRNRRTQCANQPVRECHGNPSESSATEDNPSSGKSCKQRQNQNDPSEANHLATNPTQPHSNPSRREEVNSFRRQSNPMQPQPHERSQEEVSNRQQHASQRQRHVLHPDDQRDAAQRHTQHQVPQRQRHSQSNVHSSRSNSPKPNRRRFNSDENSQRDVTDPAPLQEVMLIPTRGFNPRDLNIRHHGSSIRVHASRTCDEDRTCVSREMETSYKLPYEIERGSMKASIDGSNIVIKGRPVRSQEMEILVEEEPEDALYGEENSYESFEGDDLHEQWVLEESDPENGVFIETE